MKIFHWEKVIYITASIIIGSASILFNNVLAAFLAVFCSFIAFKSGKNLKKLNAEENLSRINNVSNSRIVLAISFLIYSIVLSIITVFLSTLDSFFTLSLISWLLSIILLVLSGLSYDQIRLFEYVNRLKAIKIQDHKEAVIEISTIFIITSIAFYLRVAYLDIVPVAVHGDEGEMGMQALRVLGIGEPLAPFRVGWGPLPSLFYYMQAVTIKLFGRNEIGLRMLSPLFGTACVPLIYYIGKMNWGKVAGFTGAWLMAVSHFHIQYSRLGLNNIESAFFVILFIFLICFSLTAQKNKRNNDAANYKNSSIQNFWQNNQNMSIYILIGTTLSIAQYMYHGSRLLPIIAIPIFVILYIRKKINLTKLLIIGLSALIVIAPLALHYLQNPRDLYGRMDTVSIFNPDNIRNKYGENTNMTSGFTKIILTQVQKNLQFFLKEGDISDFYYASVPGFDFITALLFWLGLGVILSGLMKIPEIIIFTWFVFGIIFGGIITNNPPYGARLLITTSVVYIIAGVYLQRIWNDLKYVYKKIPNNNISLMSVSAPLILILAIATFVINYNVYFQLYPSANINILSIKVTQEIIKEGPSNHIYLFGEGNLYVRHGTIRFLAGVDKATDLKQLGDLPQLQNDGKGIIVIATPAKFEEFKQIQYLFPEGKMFNVFAGSKLVFMKFEISPET
jgi:4-amino-4-deoxy-L-arabinose transferase-like glycosyltransferase